MTDGDLLLRAVLASPEDDAPRLVYADWLEENGRPERAAFIRVQIEEARLGPDCPHLAQPPGRPWHVPLPCGRCRWCALRRRAQALHDTPALLRMPHWRCCSRVEPMWEGPPAPQVPVVVWRRGFIAEAHGLLAAPPHDHFAGLLGLLPRLCASQPLTRVAAAGKRPYPPWRQGAPWQWIAGGRLRWNGWRAYAGSHEPPWRAAGHEAFLPKALWDRLPGGLPERPSRRVKCYATEADALEALSAACLAWGGGQGGGVQATSTVRLEPSRNVQLVRLAPPFWAIALLHVTDPAGSRMAQPG